MNSTWKRSDELVWEELAGETLVVSPKSGGRWSLNAMASRIWKLCDGSRSSAELAAAFKQRGAEIAAFCEALAGIGLLRLATSSGASAPAIAHFSALPNQAPAIRALGLTAGSRRRPTPRGNSGPG